jgi:hypothetical protein
MTEFRPTKLFLRVFVVSIAATAVIGIIAIAKPGDIGWFEVKVLLTTGTIAAASICGLSCAGCLTRGRTILPIAGLALTVIAACLLMLGIWTELESEIYWKLTASLSFFAVACAHLSMLFLANLAGVYRWAYLLAYQLILGLAALLAAGVFSEVLFDKESYVRFTGVVSVLVAAITLLIPVFHYMSRDQFAAAQAEADPLFVVEEEIARVKKRLIELENTRRVLLGRVEVVGAEDGPAR